MSERKEPGLNTDGLESLVVDATARPAGVARAVPPATAPSGRGGNLLVTLILLLMTAALGYLGFMLTQQQTRLTAMHAELQQARERVESLEAMLEVTSDSAEQSGETLQQRLEGVNTRMEERFAHFDSEVAKLWTIAYQRNKPQLDQHAEQLKQLQAQLTETNTALEQVRTEAGKAADALARIDSLRTEQATLKKTLQARLAAAEQQLATLEKGLKVESEGRLKVQQQLTRQLSELEGGSDVSAGLAQRIRQNEQAIKAIDGTRRQINQDLLRIRQQLNNLQLRMEQG